jgi:hypothetical protein
MTAIHISSPALELRAGHQARVHIREQGLQPADVHMIPGAAGGPKALGIQGLDLALFGDWQLAVCQRLFARSGRGSSSARRAVHQHAVSQGHQYGADQPALRSDAGRAAG